MFSFLVYLRRNLLSKHNGDPDSSHCLYTYKPVLMSDKVKAKDAFSNETNGSLPMTLSIQENSARLELNYVRVKSTFKEPNICYDEDPS